MPWDIVEFDFGGEETTNFGPRKESGSALYQIDTLATISSSENDVRIVPDVCSTVQGDLACVAVESHLSIFRDCQHAGTVGFDATVDEIEWSPDGSMIFLGCRSGRLWILDEENLDILFEFNVLPPSAKKNERAFTRISCLSRLEESFDLIVLGRAGVMMVVKDLSKSLFTSGKEEKGKLAGDIKHKLSSVKTVEYHTEGVQDMMVGDHSIITLGAGSSMIATWKWGPNTDLHIVDTASSLYDTEGMSIIQGKLSSDGNCFFALDDNHSLSLWNPHMLQQLKFWSDLRVIEFQLLETREVRNHSLHDMKLVLLTDDTDGRVSMIIKSAPTFDIVYRLQLFAPCTIAKCPAAQETLYLAECCPDENFPGTVSNVRFRCLTETNPETRLSRILYKNRFEEAVKFAKMYNLEMELVYKVKIFFLMDQLSPWNVKKYEDNKVEDMLNQIWECVDYVKDDVHLCEILIKSAFPRLEHTERTLDYCKRRLMKALTSSNDASVKEKLEILIVKLQQVQDRMVTFKMAYGEDCYSGESWERFMECDLVEEALVNMKQGQTERGIIIWTRHEREWESNVKPEMLERFLSLIPDRTKTMDILRVIRDSVIPFTVRLMPDRLKFVVKWIIQRAVNMEHQEKEHWPGNALHFLRSIIQQLNTALEIKESEVCSQIDIINKTKLNPGDVVEPVKSLISSLQHLKDLHTKYKCALNFDQFRMETTESVTFRMLDMVVAVELIQQTLERQIRPYMREHNLKEDKIFSKYVKDLLERTGRVTSYIGAAPWEAKIIAVINCISDPQYKLTAILEMMDYAPVPWTAEIEKVVQFGLKLDHSLVRELQKQVNMVKVKKLMLKYGRSGVPDRDDCLMLAKYILCSDKGEAMEDALSVMKAFNMDFTISLYLFRMRSLIIEDKLQECMSLLKEIPQSVAQTCCRRMISFVEQNIDNTKKLDVEESHKEKRMLTEAGIAFVKYLQDLATDYFEEEELGHLLFTLEKIRTLQTAYGMFLTLQQYQDENFRRSTLINFTKSVFSKSSQSFEKNYAQVYRLAEVLQISPVEMQGKLAIQAAHSGQILRAIEITSKLFEFDPTPETAETLYEVALVFTKLHNNIGEEFLNKPELRDLPYITHKLVCQALMICSPELLQRCLELSNLTYMNLTISSQCEAGEYSHSLEKERVPERSRSYLDLSKDWTPNTLFQEDALVMNSRIALPLVSSYAASHSELYDEENIEEGDDSDLASAHPLTRPAVSAVPVVQYLKDNSHHHLAYQVTLQALNTVTEATWRRIYGNLIPTQDMAEQIAERTAERELLNKLELKAQPVLRECTFSVLMKIFNCTSVDHRAALTFLLSRAKKEALSMLLRIINSAGQNYKKIKAIATVGIALATLYKEPTAIEYCQKLEKNATWGHRLSKIKISFKDVYQEEDCMKIDLLPQIAQCEAANVSLVQDYCKAFNLDGNRGLMLYLDHVFEEMHQTQIHQPTQMSREIRMKNARSAVKAITEHEQLLEKLEALYLKTSSYDYDTLEFLLEEMQKIEETPEREKKIKLLEYLKPYTRTSEPTEYEVKYGMDGKKDDLQILPSLPAESKTKLPLHPLTEGDSWQIIRAEVRKETVQTWLEIAKLLKLNSDQFYFMCVQSMVKKHISAVKKNNQAIGASGTDKEQWNWDIKDANSSLLMDVESLLQHVSNCDTALACANWVVREMPIGAEKVLGLKGCMKMARLWYEAAPENSAEREKAKGAYIKFMSVWRRMATEQVLFCHKMADLDLLQLVGEAEKLIIKLYEHPCIVNTTKEGSIPDIHTIADEIGRIYDLNVNDIRMSLIDKWLPPSSSSSRQSESESTMTFSFDALKMSCEAGNEVEDDDDDWNLQRVIYLLRRGNDEDIAAKILTFAFSNDITTESQNVSNICRVRAIRCLLKLGNESIIPMLCDKKLNTLDDLRHLLKITMYLVDLEKLHILQSVSTFEESNKEGLVRGIWRNHNHQKHACLLVATLCLDYEINDRQLWNSALQQLLAFCMYKELEIILVRLQGVPDVWQVQVFPKVWQAILTNPLTTVVPPLGDEQLSQCLQVFSLLKKCPVLGDLDLPALSQHFHRLDMMACALLCLHLCQSAHEKEADYISRHNTNILDSANSLQQHGLDSWDVKKVREVVFDHLLEHEEFEAVVQTEYKAQIVVFAIQIGNIDGLLKFSVRHNLFKEGDMLLKQYLMMYPDIQKQLDKYVQQYYDDDEESNFPLMKYFLRMKGLAESDLV